MRKLIVAAFISLDGVIQAPGGPEEDPSGGFRLGGWIVPCANEATGQAVMDLFAQPFELLLGRRTYDIFASCRSPLNWTLHYPIACCLPHSRPISVDSWW